MKHTAKVISGHSESSVIQYDYRGYTITGTTKSDSGNRFTKSRSWTVAEGLRSSSLKKAKETIDRLIEFHGK